MPSATTSNAASSAIMTEAKVDADMAMSLPVEKGSTDEYL
jgi:hypothetical protein